MMDRLTAREEILDRFAERDPRVRVICHDLNRGAAAARNLGLDAANGEFVQFTDADDLLDPDALRLLTSAARADTVPIVRGGIVGFRSATPEKQLDLDLPEGAQRRADPSRMNRPGRRGGTRRTCSHGRLLVSEGIRYPDLCSGEDPVFLARVLSRAPAVSTLSTVVYRHRLMPLGEKGRTTYRHLRDYLRHAEMTRDLFLESNGEAWHRGFAPLLLPEIRSMIDGWQMSDHERAAATAEMQRIFEPPRPLAKAARRKVLFMYRVCGLGGVETSIVNKMEALSARGIEVRAVFQSSWGEGGQVLARHPGFAIAADEEAQKRLILDWAPDAIAVVDTPRFVNVIRKAGVPLLRAVRNAHVGHRGIQETPHSRRCFELTRFEGGRAVGVQPRHARGAGCRSATRAGHSERNRYPTILGETAVGHSLAGLDCRKTAAWCCSWGDWSRRRTRWSLFAFARRCSIAGWTSTR